MLRTILVLSVAIAVTISIGATLAEAQNTSAKSTKAVKRTSTSKCPGATKFSDYNGCISYNISLGWSNPSGYCSRNCPGG
jgi:uncharacterized protein YpmB